MKRPLVEDKRIKEGELVIFYDPVKARPYLQRLVRNGKFMTHRGIIEHNQVLDKEEGEVVFTNTEKEFFVFRPTLKEFIKKMARKSAIMHPKDLGIVLLWADIYPGLKVVEAGSGSGALLLTLARIVGEDGEVISYDVREDLQEIAKSNIKNFLGELPQLKFKIKDIYRGIEEEDVDRVILDLPCPWEAINTLKESLRPGGIVLAYLPTIIQSEKFVKALEREKEFFLIETLESIIRPWNIDGLSVRPQQRIIGHTGFITTARKTERR
ncbi:MAG: tRNA (adenine-N1)-methyltransferase [Candidatus Omnitrophica bacterium]|nr:tRNA (adenine-N1)-methyltransferase [Candidatus Omnitrophota bacterium]